MSIALLKLILIVQSVYTTSSVGYKAIKEDADTGNDWLKEFSKKDYITWIITPKYSHSLEHVRTKELKHSWMTHIKQLFAYWDSVNDTGNSACQLIFPGKKLDSDAFAKHLLEEEISLTKEYNPRVEPGHEYIWTEASYLHVGDTANKVQVITDEQVEDADGCNELCIMISKKCRALYFDESLKMCTIFSDVGQLRKPEVLSEIQYYNGYWTTYENEMIEGELLAVVKPEIYELSENSTEKVDNSSMIVGLRSCQLRCWQTIGCNAVNLADNSCYLVGWVGPQHTLRKGVRSAVIGGWREVRNKMWINQRSRVKSIKLGYNASISSSSWTWRESCLSRCRSTAGCRLATATQQFCELRSIVDTEFISIPEEKNLISWYFVGEDLPPLSVIKFDTTLKPRLKVQYQISGRGSGENCEAKCRASNCDFSTAEVQYRWLSIHKEDHGSIQWRSNKFYQPYRWVTRYGTVNMCNMTKFAPTLTERNKWLPYGWGDTPWYWGSHAIPQKNSVSFKKKFSDELYMHLPYEGEYYYSCAGLRKLFPGNSIDKFETPLIDSGGTLSDAVQTALAQLNTASNMTTTRSRSYIVIYGGTPQQLTDPNPPVEALKFLITPGNEATRDLITNLTAVGGDRAGIVIYGSQKEIQQWKILVKFWDIFKRVSKVPIPCSRVAPSWRHLCTNDTNESIRNCISAPLNHEWVRKADSVLDTLLIQEMKNEKPDRNFIREKTLELKLSYCVETFTKAYVKKFDNLQLLETRIIQGKSVRMEKVNKLRNLLTAPKRKLVLIEESGGKARNITDDSLMMQHANYL